MTQEEYRERTRVRRKLASLKRQGFIRDYKFQGDTWVLIYLRDRVLLWPISKTLERLAEMNLEVIA